MMGTNYYLAPPPGEEQHPTERWEECGRSAIEVLRKRGITLEEPRACALAQEILDALRITEVSVLERVRGQHLGKESVAGPYCTRCDVSLVTGKPGGRNVENPHAVASVSSEPRTTCRQCELWDMVQPSSSFTFAMRPEEIDAIPPDARIVNEYGKEMSAADFRQNVIGRTRFTFTHQVGVEFS